MEKRREVVNVEWKTKTFSVKLPVKVVNDNFLMYGDECKLVLSGVFMRIWCKAGPWKRGLESETGSEHP